MNKTKNLTPKERYDNIKMMLDSKGVIRPYVDELEQRITELNNILFPVKEIIDRYELYNELSIELIYDRLEELTGLKSKESLG